MGRLATAFILATAFTTSAHALVMCRTPDGKTYAGDTPPPGCVVTKSFVIAPAAPSAPEEPAARTDTRRMDSAFEAEAIVKRRRIEKEINEAADGLLAARNAIAEYDRNSPNYETWSKEQIDAYWAARRSYLSRESDARVTIMRLRSEFDTLSRLVAMRNGGAAPSTWRATLNCEYCP